MAHNVFISFRYADGHHYKEDLAKRFDNNNDTIDFSEEIDRSYLSEASIQDYLYKKLKRTTVTIILLTPQAVNHKKNHYGQYSDWMYDEIRYSLEDRANNRSSGLIAVYTPESEKYLINRSSLGYSINKVDNLFRPNMMNVKPQYKRNPSLGTYDLFYDSYCSLIPYAEFTNNISWFIDNASKKRDESYKYNIVRRL